MKSDTATRLVRLSGGALMRLHNAKGRRIKAAHGAVWITQENDPRDVILEQNGSFTFDREGVALAHALAAPALLSVETGTDIELVRRPAAPAATFDVTPGSPVYRRARELRARAMVHLFQALAAKLRCFTKTLCVESKGIRP